MKFIFTCGEQHAKLTLYELGLYDSSFAFEGWLAPDTGLGTTEHDTAALLDIIRNSPVIFLRHIFRVDTELAPDGIEAAVAGLCRERLDISDSFCVQIRACDTPCADQTGLAARISDILSADGYKLDVRNGIQAISLYIADNTVYCGVGYTSENLSKWRGGMPFYAHSEEFGFISRSEYKLREAVDGFGIDLSQMKSALDLGAAPGGWTKLLAEEGLHVVSVDPNQLDEDMRKNPAVSVFRMTAERYLKQPSKEKFDIIVNDMKMDVRDSIAVTVSFRDRLKPGGYAVITFKLPHEFSYKHILAALHSAEGFTLYGARQFYHNRSEITAVYRVNDVN